MFDGIRGKPLVVSLVFTACSSVCPPTTQHVIDAVNEAGRMIGLDRFIQLSGDQGADMAAIASYLGHRRGRKPERGRGNGARASGSGKRHRLCREGRRGDDQEQGKQDLVHASSKGLAFAPLARTRRYRSHGVITRTANHTGRV